MQPFRSIRFRVIAFTAACVAVVGIAGNLSIYNYLKGIIEEKARLIDETNRSAIAAQLDIQLQTAMTLPVQCANFPTILSLASDSLAKRQPNTRLLEGQKVMGNAISASSVNRYLNKMMLYNRSKMLVQPYAQHQSGDMRDHIFLIESPFYQELLEGSLSGGRLRLIPSSITPYYEGPCLASIQPVTTGPAANSRAWLYTEFSINLVTDILDNYLPSGLYFLSGPGGLILPSHISEESRKVIAHHDLENERTFTLNDELWRTVSAPLPNFPEFELVGCINESALRLDNQKIFQTVLLALAGSLVAGFAITVFMSNMLTKPIIRLTNRIRRISNNDFEFDPSIEKGSDEIASIGKVVNEMTLSVQHLLAVTQTQAEQKRKIELAMLQSQVNPHFLYNTLDSIHWMAVIQKNPGIQNMTRSLSNLLKHMAKGYNHKISLAEEVDLLMDYIEIMSVRYMDTFEFVNELPSEFSEYKIIKLTLQPLVENAIFHGIEPTGRFGTIRLYGSEEGDDLLLTVEDDGQGMDAAAIHRALTEQPQDNHASMNGIGVSNVNERLRLVYGEGYGLTIQSEPGKYTRMTVRIPKEEEQ